MVGQVLGAVDALPDIYTELTISFFLLRRLLGVKTEGDKRGAKVKIIVVLCRKISGWSLVDKKQNKTKNIVMNSRLEEYLDESVAYFSGGGWVWQRCRVSYVTGASN